MTKSYPKNKSIDEKGRSLWSMSLYSGELSFNLRLLLVWPLIMVYKVISVQSILDSRSIVSNYCLQSSVSCISVYACLCKKWRTFVGKLPGSITSFLFCISHFINIEKTNGVLYPCKCAGLKAYFPQSNAINIMHCLDQRRWRKNCYNNFHKKGHILTWTFLWSHIYYSELCFQRSGGGVMWMCN